MNFVLVALLGLALSGLVAQAMPSDLHEWNQYKLEHGKAYETPEEDSRRFKLFLAAKEEIQKHNAQSTSYKLGLNHLSDWSSEELNRFAGTQLGAESAWVSNEKTTERQVDSSALEPKEVDWRKVPNRVTSVKDQGQCRSDWAFATVGVLEGQVAVRTNNTKLQSLSAQSILDCTVPDNGCDGGSISKAMLSIFYRGGVSTDEDYPYVAKEGECRFDKSKSVISDRGFNAFGATEEKLAKLVANFGPVAASLSTEGWQHYKSGVFNNPKCEKPAHAGHGVLIVGHGTDPESGDYWIVKNSWSEKWGEGGYMRLRRGKNRCGVGYNGVIPNF